MTRQTPNRLAAQRRDVIPHTPRSGVRLQLSHAAQRRLSSLATRRAAACVFTSSHAAQRRVSSPPTRCTAHTPRSGACLNFRTRRAAACVFASSHAAQRRVSALRSRRAAACFFTSHTPRSGVTSPSLMPRSGAYLASHTPRSGVCLHILHAAQRRVSSLPTRRAAA
jgi:hypothetical protein